MERTGSIGTEELFDCIVIGAGPGGLQACIHLGRYNFRVLLFHRPGGRTHHAKHIENYLGLRAVPGPDPPGNGPCPGGELRRHCRAR